MFTRATQFSARINQFCSDLDKLTFNDGVAIGRITAAANELPSSDAPVAVACVQYQIIHNPSKTRLPILYVMDSICKNARAQPYVSYFEPLLPTLIGAVYDITDTAPERLSLDKLVASWISRAAFSVPMLQGLYEHIKLSEKRRAVSPVPSGWPPVLPPGTDQLPEIELTVAKSLYAALFPISKPSVEELLFTKDAVVSLHEILQNIKQVIGRPFDNEVNMLLEQYRTIQQAKAMILGTPGTSTASFSSTLPSSSSSSTSTQPGNVPPTSQVSGFPSPVHGFPTHPSIVPPPHQLLHPYHPNPNFPGPPSTSVNPPSTLKPSPSESSSKLVSPNITSSSITTTVVPKSAKLPTSEVKGVQISISNPSSLSLHNQAAIDSLYDAMKHQCTTCGMRFKTNEDLATHLNWHYFEKTSQKYSGLQRQWYWHVGDWIKTSGGSKSQVMDADGKIHLATSESITSKEVNGLHESTAIVRIPDDEQFEQAICAGCGEDLDAPGYDADGWYYPATVRSEKDGKLYHFKCYASTVKNEEEGASSTKMETDSSESDTYSTQNVHIKSEPVPSAASDAISHPDDSKSNPKKRSLDDSSNALHRGPNGSHLNASGEEFDELDLGPSPAKKPKFEES